MTILATKNIPVYYCEKSALFLGHVHALTGATCTDRMLLQTIGALKDLPYK